METESSEDTVRRLLSGYEIGSKLRHLRLRKKVSLVDLGKHTGLSASMLSQLENGKLIPTLPTLARIATVFDVGLEYFFGGKRKKSLFGIVRAGERIRFPERPDTPNPAYYFENLAFATADKSLDAYLAEFPTRSEDEMALHFHNGSEFVHVLDGYLVIRYEDEDHTLEAGDSVYFDATQPHGYRGLTTNPARAFVITAPPRI